MTISNAPKKNCFHSAFPRMTSFLKGSDDQYIPEQKVNKVTRRIVTE